MEFWVFTCLVQGCGSGFIGGGCIAQDSYPNPIPEAWLAKNSIYLQM